MNDEVVRGSPERAVFQVVAGIPRGRVLSYGEVARRAGLSNGARRVGRILSRAPEDVELPWHRVVNASGRITIPDPELAEEQARRLRAEGLEVRGRAVIGGLSNEAADALDALLWRPDSDVGGEEGTG